jgi:hypothetical protein
LPLRVGEKDKLLDPDTLAALRVEVQNSVTGDRHLLEELLEEVRPLVSTQHRIQPRSTTSVSMVGTDGGNNQLQFDPFLVQIIRIVDSNKNQLWLEVVTPTTPVKKLDATHLGEDGRGRTPLGRMMNALNVKSVAGLAPAIHDRKDRPRSPSWTNVYREITEWALLLDLLQKDYGSDTLFIFDGYLRSKVFKGTLFIEYGKLLERAIEVHRRKGRNIYIVGVAKSSAVLARYRLALKLKGILRGRYPCYVRVPRDLEKKAYVWSEYARGRDDAEDGGEAAKFVNGAMFFVKFGDRPQDTVWPVDIFEPQVPQAGVILGYLVQDAKDGFPTSLYPRSLQKAHEGAALFGLDMDLLQDVVTAGVREVLSGQESVLDEFIFEPSDPAQDRY